MNIFKNKYFLLGNLAFLLIVIPVVLFFVKNQTSTRGSAAPTSTLSFIDPTVIADQCDNSKTARLVLNPGQNVVNRVALALKWDKTKFDVVFTPNKTAFSDIAKDAVYPPEGGSMTITLTIGPDVTKAISTTTDVGTVQIKPIAPTTKVDLEVDPVNTKIFSLSGQDGAAENVLNPGGLVPLQVAITAKVCTDVTVTPTVTDTQSQTSITPTVTTQPTITSAVTPTTTAATPTSAAANQSPTCLNLASSTSSGSAPLSVTLTATGRDTDGIVSKATFNFGDGSQQDVTTGLGTASVSAQLAHTYNSGGNFTSTAVFTDNSGAVSATCSQVIAVSGAIATIPPTATPTVEIGSISPTDTPTATPTISNPGGVSVTFGLVGGIVLAIIAGIFLLAL